MDADLIRMAEFVGATDMAAVAGAGPAGAVAAPVVWMWGLMHLR